MTELRCLPYDLESMGMTLLIYMKAQHPTSTIGLVDVSSLRLLSLATHIVTLLLLGSTWAFCGIIISIDPESLACSWLLRSMKRIIRACGGKRNYDRKATFSLGR